MSTFIGCRMLRKKLRRRDRNLKIPSFWALASTTATKPRNWHQVAVQSQRKETFDTRCQTLKLYRRFVTANPTTTSKNFSSRSESKDQPPCQCINLSHPSPSTTTNRLFVGTVPLKFHAPKQNAFRKLLRRSICSARKNYRRSLRRSSNKRIYKISSKRKRMRRDCSSLASHLSSWPPSSI